MYWASPPRPPSIQQAYANSAVCSATRAALITGRYQYRLPVGLEEPLTGLSPDVGLPPEHPTLPSLLKKAGYGTTLVGKWHLGNLPKYGPLQSGYERFWGYRGGGIDYFRHVGVNNRPDLWDGDVPVSRTGYLTHLLGQRAVQAIDDHAASGRPFLLSVHFSAPHWPWLGPDDEAESTRLGGGARLRHYDGGSMKTYARMVQALDAEVGRILAALQARRLQDNTVVVFTSDNGGERFAFTWPFTGRKTELLEGGIRVPTILSWPGVVPRGTTSDQVAISMDWLPTLLGAAGAPLDPAYPSDGVDLLPLLQRGTPLPRTLYWRYKAHAQRAMRDGNLKYLKMRDETYLFDVVDDPLERANLKVRRKEDFERLVRQWEAWNATMLPENERSFTEGTSAAQYADRIGTPRSSTRGD